ncbi:SRPBCC family protein [Methylocystis heyeri]|nr:SRPBCC family protein [Methylocystis heyeri]
MLTYVLLLLLGLIGGVVAAASLRPDSFSISRNSIIDAPAADVFESIGDFHKWEEWSPWAKLDPNAKRIFDGVPGVVGSSFEWAGNAKLGAGRMTLLESVRDEMLRMRLTLKRPIKATTLVTFALSPEGAGTRLVWSMSGKHDIFGKLFALFVDPDKFCGKDFERGLANLKKLVETRQAA